MAKSLCFLLEGPHLRVIPGATPPLNCYFLFQEVNSIKCDLQRGCFTFSKKVTLSRAQIIVPALCTNIWQSWDGGHRDHFLKLSDRYLTNICCSGCDIMNNQLKQIKRIHAECLFPPIATCPYVCATAVVSVVLHSTKLQLCVYLWTDGSVAVCHCYHIIHNI